MSYTKNTWVDQNVERPKTYEVTNNQDGSITLTDSFGLVTELGTPVNATNMNHIEDGLALSDLMKYDATVTYSTGEWVTGAVDNEKGIYTSLVDNNVGNALSDDTKWKKVELGGSSRNIGEIVSSTLPLTDAGLHLLDGALIQYGSYSAFVDYIADLYTQDPTANYFTTESAWQSSVTTYGSCGKFVYDSTNNTVRLPKVSDILQGTTDINALGDLVEAGLPSMTTNTTGAHTHERGTMNITGTFAFTDNNTTSLRVRATDLSGAFSSTASNLETLSSNDDYNTMNVQHKVNFNASSSWTGETSENGNHSHIVNTGVRTASTVQPQTAKCFVYIVIATSAKTDIQVNIDEIVTDLNGKADTDLVNITDTGKVMMSGIGMPSSESISLTLGASGSTYTAPSNGYLYCRFNTTGGTGYSWIWLVVAGGLQSRSNNYMVSNQTSLGCLAWVPVLKGQTVTINYGYVGNINNSDLRFVYAKGSESEAS